MSRNAGQLVKEFIGYFQELAYRHSPWNVWADFCEISAIGASNVVDRIHADQREETYMKIISKYTNEETNLFPKMLAIVVLELTRDPKQDFLGKLYMELNLNDEGKAQIFTPYSMSEAMARLCCEGVTIDKLQIEELKATVARKGYVTIHDPTCGAGSTLIGARNALQEAGIGTSQSYFVGQDLSSTAVYMCYIQLSLLGCAGYLCIGDSLLNPTGMYGLLPAKLEGQDIWILPATFLDPVWAGRIHWRQMMLAINRTAK